MTLIPDQGKRQVVSDFLVAKNSGRELIGERMTWPNKALQRTAYGRSLPLPVGFCALICRWMAGLQAVAELGR